MAATITALRPTATSSLLPRLSAPTLLSSSRFAAVYAQQLSIPLIPSFHVPIPSSIQLSIPALPSPLSILEDLWEGILRAVPKKKTSHSKKRHRQMAGKALKDVTALCKCPACGRLKRMHYLCPYCMKSLQGMMKGMNKWISKTNKDAPTDP